MSILLLLSLHNVKTLPFKKYIIVLLFSKSEMSSGIYVNVSLFANGRNKEGCSPCNHLKDMLGQEQDIQ